MYFPILSIGRVHFLGLLCGIFHFYSNFKDTKSATMNIFRIFYFVFKSFVKVELSYVFTINLFTIAENCTEK